MDSRLNKPLKIWWKYWAYKVGSVSFCMNGVKGVDELEVTIIIFPRDLFSWLIKSKSNWCSWTANFGFFSGGGGAVVRSRETNCFVGTAMAFPFIKLELSVTFGVAGARPGVA